MFTPEKVPHNSPLRWTISKLEGFCRTKEGLLDMFGSVIDPIIEANLYNPEAVCRVTNIDTETINISDLQYAEDYEILTGSYDYTDESGESHHFCDKPEALEELPKILRQIKFDELIADEDFYIREVGGMFFVYDEDPADSETVPMSSWHEKKCAEDYILNEDNSDWEDDSATQAEELLDDPNECEFTPDEVMWNWAWRYNDSDIDIDIAEKCGLIVIEIINQEHSNYGDTFVTISGCGMDLSATIISYQALKFSAIKEDDIYSIIRQPDYFRQVAHGAWPEVIKTLGLGHIYTDDGDMTEEAKNYGKLSTERPEINNS